MVFNELFSLTRAVLQFPQPHSKGSRPERLFYWHVELFLGQESGTDPCFPPIAAPCGGNLTGSNGFILSPNFPHPYPHSKDCDWLIAVNSDYVLSLAFIR